MNWKRPILIAFIVALLLACGVKAAEPTPTLFVFPVLTSTQLPATPTSTPTTIPTSSPTLSELPLDVAEYYTSTYPLIAIMQTGLSGFTEQSAQIASDPSLIYDVSWQTAIILDIAFMNYAHSELIDVVPPPDMAAIHASLLSATKDCTEAADSYSLAIDKLDSYYIEDANNLMSSCGDELHTTASLLQEYNAQYVVDPNTLQQDLRAYLARRQALLNVALGFKHTFDTTFGLVIEGEVTGDNTEWQAKCEGLITQFDVVVSVYNSIVVPDPFATANNKTMSALENCSNGFRTLLTAVETNDQELYQSGIPYITACNDEWNESNRLTQEAITNAGLTDNYSFAGPSP